MVKQAGQTTGNGQATERFAICTEQNDSPFQFVHQGAKIISGDLGALCLSVCCSCGTIPSTVNVCPLLIFLYAKPTLGGWMLETMQDEGRYKSYIQRWIAQWLAKKSPVDSAAWISQIVTGYARSRSASETLRFLFDLDARLYTLQGRMAIEYDNGIHTKHRHIRYHDFFVNRIHSDERVIDLGCGNGAVAYDIAEKTGASVVGIDLNETNIAMACQLFAHPHVEFLAGDVLKYLPEKTFDVIVLSNVLEHLPERPLFLRKACLQTGAHRILIRVPLFERDWRVPLKKELGVEWRLDPTHETEYTQESFCKEMEEAGLEIRDQEFRWGEIWAELEHK
ncbi:MAG: class I SAM-dependent methyltransferase [Planctomycetota bacterium]